MFEVKPLKTFVIIGTIPYIQPATRKEYFVIAEKTTTKYSELCIQTMVSEI